MCKNSNFKQKYLSDWTNDLMSFGDPRFHPQGKGVSQEPQLADTIDNKYIGNSELSKNLDLISNEETPILPNLPKYVTDHIPPEDRNEFLFYFSKDNFEAITLKYKPEFWNDKRYVYHKVIDYCVARKILYYFNYECGKDNSNLHSHGIFGFPNNKARKNFQVWFNKHLGKLFTSNKDNLNIWYDYVHGLVPKKIGDNYMF